MNVIKNHALLVKIAIREFFSEEGSIFAALKNFVVSLVAALIMSLLDYRDVPSRIFEKIVCLGSQCEIKSVAKDIFALATAAVVTLILVLLVWGMVVPRIADKRINENDQNVIRGVIAGAVYLLIIEGLNCHSGYKVALFCYFISLCIRYLIIRICVVYENDQKQKELPVSVLSLVELYKGEVNTSSGKVLIQDAECDEDIFDRSITINKITSIIRCNNNGRCFALSLVGAWGVGKSTILKCVKRKIEEGEKDIIFIDDFQPWIYKNADEMIVGFGNTLLNKIGYRRSFVYSRAIADAFLKTTAQVDSTGILSKIKIPEIKEDPIGIINDYLLGRNKKLVIVLDNLERCELKEIVRFLRAVKNHLQFYNSYYIFSYDDIIMRECLEDNEIDKMFLDKFSQCTIPVPDIPEENKKEIIEKCFDNYYSMTSREKGANYKEFLSTISMVVKTPRELIHIINSAYVGEIKFLNQTDSILINILKQNAPNIYSIIKNNRNKFVYDSSSYFDVMMGRSDREENLKKYCQGEAEYFNSILGDEKNAADFIKYKPILSLLFPSVNVFMQGQDNRALYEAGILKGDYERAYSKRSVCREELFEPYFTQAKNRHVEICEEVDAILARDPESITNLVVSYAKNLDDSSVGDVLQHLKEKICELDIDKRDAIATNILGILLNMNGKVESKNRVIIDCLMGYLANAVPSISEPVFSSMLAQLECDYKNLGILNSLNNYIHNSNDRMNSGRLIPIHKALDAMKNRIINQEINIYKKNNYLRFNIRMLGENSVKIDYLKKIIDKVPKRNRILMLADFVYWGGSGDKNFYEIDDKIVKSVFSNEDISDIIKSAKASRLKTAIRKIFSKATDEVSGYLQGDRVYNGPEEFNLFSLCNEYINE